MSKDLIREIDAFLAEFSIGEYHFGLLAAKNGRLVERLREGGEILPRTEKKIREFMRNEAPIRREKAERRKLKFQSEATA